MTTRICSTKADCQAVSELMLNMKLPITVNIRKGKDRSVEQNKLQRMWLYEAAEQLQDETIEQKRGYCKLHFGVPILRNEDDTFREAYDRLIRPHTYEEKLQMMMIPLDFPVTRLMTTGQHKRYLDDIHDFFTGLGVQLTEPDEEK